MNLIAALNDILADKNSGCFNPNAHAVKTADARQIGRTRSSVKYRDRIRRRGRKQETSDNA